jgi:hypothetical protein
MTFLHAEISEDYLQYLFTDEGNHDETFLEVSQTKAYHLDLPQDRKVAAQIIVSLVEFYTASMQE